MPSQDGKYKGVKGQGNRQGLGRLRRANTQNPARVSGLERQDEDGEVFDRLTTKSGSSHSGETLLARFNRVARSPASATGLRGVVTGFSGALIRVLGVDGVDLPCTVRQALKKQIGGVKNPLCVGDVVHYLPADRPLEDDTGVVTGIEPRRNQLERADSHNRSLIHVFAANLDCLIIVSSVGAPEFKPGLIDRYLVIAGANAIPAVVVINKSDLADATLARDLYRRLGIPVFLTCAGRGAAEAGVRELGTFLLGKTCVFAGQSGVGKSSLINALFPSLAARTGTVALAGHGRHTTTSAVAYRLPGGGQLVDSPGVRECAITGLSAQAVALQYPEFAACQGLCRFTNCTHLHEPECAVRAGLAAGTISPSRWESYRSIVTEDLAEH